MTEDVNLSTWMSDLPPGLKSLPLCRLAIPGTHNSFTYSLSSDSSIGTDESAWLRKLSRLLPCCVKPIVYNWAVCQKASCRRQLENGVRYLDFRLGIERDSLKTAREDSPPPRILHALFGSEVRLVLEEIRGFLESHPTEVVILDFQRVYGLAAGDRRGLCELVAKTFGEMLCPTSVGSGVSLQRLQDGGLQVMAVAQWANDDDDDSSSHPRFFWPRLSFPNPWPDTVDGHHLLAVSSSNLRSRDCSRFYVSQFIFTARTADVLRHPFSGLEGGGLAKRCDRILEEEWLPELRRDPRLLRSVNIVIADFVVGNGDSGDGKNSNRLAKEIVGLNYVYTGGEDAK